MLLKDFFQSGICSGCLSAIIYSDKWDGEETFLLGGEYPSVWTVSTAPVLSYNILADIVRIKIKQ